MKLFCVYPPSPTTALLAIVISSLALVIDILVPPANVTSSVPLPDPAAVKRITFLFAVPSAADIEYVVSVSFKVLSDTHEIFHLC